MCRQNIAYAGLTVSNPELQEEICTHITGINPRLKTKYVHPTNRNLREIRATPSVIAALMASLTLTAGITVPGGFDSDTGEAILAKKAAFLVFLLSDAFAMRCSMLVLFCLVWSMISDPNKTDAD